MLKISLKAIPPRSLDGSINLPVEEALMVSGRWYEPDAMETNHVYLLLQLLASKGRVGPFSVEDLHTESRRGPRLVTAESPPDLTLDEIERGMRRLLELGVAVAAPPDLRLL